MAIAENKSERIEVRTTSTLKALLQRAAASSHKNVKGSAQNRANLYAKPFASHET